jgi:hypothetical protein
MAGAAETSMLRIAGGLFGGLSRDEENSGADRLPLVAALNSVFGVGFERWCDYT